MSFRISFNGKRLGREIGTAMMRTSARSRRAFSGALRDARDSFLKRAAADIAKSGKFGPRWTKGFISTITEDERRGIYRVLFTHKIPYFMVHQTGKTIRGKPELAIPLSVEYGGDRRAQGVRARDFPEPLFRVDRKHGKPLLLSKEDGKPKYFLAKSVKLPKRFHVLEIARDVAKNLRTFFSKRLKRK